MQKEKFNPLDWLEKPDQKATHTEPQITEQDQQITEVETIIRQIEARQIDIATAYSDWRNIGFAFADAFGEQGRQFFHRVSCFYSDYSKADCDRQFDNCLKAKGQGISLKTFFYHARNAGIPLGAQSLEQEQEQTPVPTFPDGIYASLPDFLQQVVAPATTPEEKDLLLLGAITALSACLPQIYGLYDGRRVFPNLYLFVTAQASAGKGRMVHCKQLVMPVHRLMREQARRLKQEYELELAEYNANKGKDHSAEKPAKPPEKLLIIPANNSTTGVFQLLHDSDGKGLIFETEGDTLAQAFKSDYGNYSDGFRKAFHHETISYYRRTDREYVDIETPCLSAVLSGTPKQVSALIPNAENGLFSRFIFYFMNVRPEWKNVFAENTGQGLDDYFDNLGHQFFELYQVLNASPEMQFLLTPDQENRFNQFFARVQDTYLALLGNDYMATVRRLGLIAFRMCMIFSALRIQENGDISPRIHCEEQDFQSALDMIKVLLKHASKVFSELPEDIKPARKKNRKERYLEALPHTFNRQKYLQVASALSIAHKTAEGYITEFFRKGLIHREHQDHYINLTHAESQEIKEAKEGGSV